MMRHANAIGGRWPEAPDCRSVFSPSDVTDLIGAYDVADENLVLEAIQAARGAFATWSRTNAQERSDILDRIGRTILEQEVELGTLLAREEGKTLREARAEVVRAGQIFRFFAGECFRPVGEILPSVRDRVSIEVRRQAIGVVGLITPWNFPIAIPAWKAAPALAYGNCVVMKPSDLTPGSAWALAQIIHEAGVPPGVFNLVMGRGSVIGPILTEHYDIDAISFTGSQVVGTQIAQSCAAGFRKCQLEMGGKNPLVVLDDADLDLAVSIAIDGGFLSTGQRCTASSRVIVTERIHDAFVERFVAAARGLKVGHALDPATVVGPVVSERQLASNLHYVQRGLEEGATLQCGGERLDLETRGFFMQPAVFTDVLPTMLIAREEIFGPVVAVLKANDREHALDLANDTPFGLSAGVVTRSLADAQHFKERLRAGMVMVNLPTAGVELQAAFGGTRGSSMGAREQGAYAREFYTEAKTAYVRH